MSIRPATLDDVNQLVEIEKRSYTGTGESPWEAHKFIYYIKNPYSFVLVSCKDKLILGKVVGIIYYGPYSTGLQILDLSVRPTYKKKGIGYALLNYLELLGNHLGCSYSALYVMRNNTAAINLYKKLGYEKINCVFEKQGKLRMKKELK